MKIDQNVTFLKSTAVAPALAQVKGGAAATAPETAATQSRPASPTTLLPSTNGDFDAARVARIRESISAGQYKVDTGKIADGLLATVRDLLKNKDTP